MGQSDSKYPRSLQGSGPGFETPASHSSTVPPPLGTPSSLSAPPFSVDGDELPELRRVVAPFVGVDDQQQLTVSLNDMVSVRQKSDTGWWFGEFRSKSGWFPQSCLDLDEKIILHARAHAVFKAEQDGEVDLEPGDLVKVLNNESATWWLGFVLDRAGYFPCDFVDIEDVIAAKRSDDIADLQHLLSEAHLEIERVKTENKLQTDNAKLEARLRSNLSVTVLELQEQLKTLQTEVVSLRETRARQDVQAQMYLQRIADEERTRETLEQQVIIADQRLQEETKARMIALLSSTPNNASDAPSLSTTDLEGEVEEYRRKLAASDRQKQYFERRCAQLEQEVQLARAEMSTLTKDQHVVMSKMESQLEELRSRIGSGGDMAQMVTLLQAQVESLQTELKKKLSTESAARKRAEEANSAREVDTSDIRHALATTQSALARTESQLDAAKRALTDLEEVKIRNEERIRHLQDQCQSFETQAMTLKSKLEQSNSARARAETAGESHRIDAERYASTLQESRLMDRSDSESMKAALELPERDSMSVTSKSTAATKTDSIRGSSQVPGWSGNSAIGGPVARAHLGVAPSSPRLGILSSAAQDLDRTRQSLDQQIRQRQELEQRKAVLAQKLAETEQVMSGSRSPVSVSGLSRSFSATPRPSIYSSVNPLSSPATTVPRPLSATLGPAPILIPNPPSNIPPPVRARDILNQARGIPKPF